MSNRKAEKLVNKKWVRLEVKDIKKGDIVRMVEANGTLDPITEMGVVADTDAFQDGHSGDWAFHADFSKGVNQ